MILYIKSDMFAIYLHNYCFYFLIPNIPLADNTSVILLK